MGCRAESVSRCIKPGHVGVGYDRLYSKPWEYISEQHRQNPWRLLDTKMDGWDFPGHPVVDFAIQCRVVQVQSLVGKLRSHMSLAGKKKKWHKNIK